MTRFLVDAHLPLKLARAMRAAGYDTRHTRDSPNANATKDSQINALSLAEQSVVVTKDADFVESFTLQARPYKLLLISYLSVLEIFATLNFLSYLWGGSTIWLTYSKATAISKWLATPLSFMSRRS